MRATPRQSVPCLCVEQTRDCGDAAVSRLRQAHRRGEKSGPGPSGDRARLRWAAQPQEATLTSDSRDTGYGGAPRRSSSSLTNRRFPRSRFVRSFFLDWTSMSHLESCSSLAEPGGGERPGSGLRCPESAVHWKSRPASSWFKAPAYRSHASLRLSEGAARNLPGRAG